MLAGPGLPGFRKQPATGLFAKLKQYVRETQPQTKDLHSGGGPLSVACQPGLGDLPCLGLAG